jgi:hypothetical protein
MTQMEVESLKKSRAVVWKRIGKSLERPWGGNYHPGCKGLCSGLQAECVLAEYDARAFFVESVG